MKLSTLLISAIIFLFSCKGKQGDPGPVGATGPQGPQGVQPIILDFKYVHSKNILGSNIGNNELFKDQGGLTKFYNRDTDAIFIYMKAGAQDNITKNFTLYQLPILIKDSIKFDFLVRQPTGAVPDNILQILCYVPTATEPASNSSFSGHYPYSRDTTIYYRALIVKGQAPITYQRQGSN